MNATEWVRRQAEALAAKARVDSSAKSESRARDAEENVEERVEEDIEETAEAPEPAEEEPAAAKLAAAKVDERATSAKVAASESARSGTNADPAADAPLLGRSPRASDTKTALRKTSGLGGSSPSTSSTGRALLSRRRKAKLGGEASRNAEAREDAAIRFRSDFGGDFGGDDARRGNVLRRFVGRLVRAVSRVFQDVQVGAQGETVRGEEGAREADSVAGEGETRG